MLKLILMELSESSPACQWVRLGDLDFPSRTSFSGPGYLATAPSQSCLDYLLRWHNGRVLQWLGVHYVIDLQIESLTAITLSFSSPQWPEMNWCDLMAQSRATVRAFICQRRLEQARAAWTGCRGFHPELPATNSLRESLRNRKREASRTCALFLAGPTRTYLVVLRFAAVLLPRLSRSMYSSSFWL